MGTLRHTCVLTARTCVRTPASSPQHWRYVLRVLVYLISVCSLQFCMNWSRSWILIYSSWGPCSSWFPTFRLSFVFSQDKFRNKTNKGMYLENSVPQLPGLHKFWTPGHHGICSFLSALCPFVSLPPNLSLFFTPPCTSHWNIFLVPILLFSSFHTFISSPPLSCIFFYPLIVHFILNWQTY
jgi:hypothetical protein